LWWGIHLETSKGPASLEIGQLTIWTVHAKRRKASERLAGAAATPVKLGLCRPYLIKTGVVMSQVCDVCGKGPQFGNNISHAHNVSKRRWNVNLRPVKAKVGGGNKKLRVCTSCLRSGKVVKA
jgi:large subunit ribosomal protein L28